ncbi:MAG: potassium-transporting ATPase subunit F, partial [Mesorhizobium sp.]
LLAYLTYALARPERF